MLQLQYRPLGTGNSNGEWHLYDETNRRRPTKAMVQTRRELIRANLYETRFHDTRVK